jgi:hypothetical protein
MPNAKSYGVFCQWHPSNFTVFISSLFFLATFAFTPRTASSIFATHNTSIDFSCAEQSHMFCKALFFSSPTICARSLATADPKEQKKLGRQIPGFTEWHWDQVKSRAARVGDWYKFTEPRNAISKRVVNKLPTVEEIENVLKLPDAERPAARGRGSWRKRLGGIECGVFYIMKDRRKYIGEVGWKVFDGCQGEDMGVGADRGERREERWRGFGNGMGRSMRTGQRRIDGEVV